MNKKIKVELSSNLKYENMVVYISLGNIELALLNYEKGVDSIEIELLPLPSGYEKPELLLKEFIIALERGKEILIRCAEEDKNRKQY